MVAFWDRLSRGKRWTAIVILVVAGLAVGPWMVLVLMQLALIPLLAMWLPYLKIVPALYNFRLRHVLARHYAALAEAEQAMERVRDPGELRRRLHELDNLRLDLRALSRQLPTAMQVDLYQWRLHIDLVRREALERLGSLESPSPIGPVSFAPRLALNSRSL